MKLFIFWFLFAKWKDFKYLFKVSEVFNHFLPIFFLMCALMERWPVKLDGKALHQYQIEKTHSLSRPFSPLNTFATGKKCL